MRLGASRTLRNFTVQVPDAGSEVAFEIETADSGEEALQIIHRQPPDILLLDHKMPGISGMDVIDRTRHLHNEMAVIMITAYASIETAVAATKRGAYNFIAKPFTPDALRAAVRQAASHVVLGRQARKLADEKRRVRFEFIRVLGHELKAPLNAIEGYLNLMESRALGDQLTDYAQTVDRCKLRMEGMRKLILDLLDMTHIESGRKNRELARLHLREITEIAIETYLSSAQQRGINIALHADNSLTMVADRSELEMILNNLISNAVKYNRDGGRVDVTLEGRDDHVRIVVADTGIGMTPDEAGKLFGEFVRIRNAKTSSILGSGLGLSIVKKLAQLYAGEATVESQPDVGSTFAVVLNSSPEMDGHG